MKNSAITSSAILLFALPLSAEISVVNGLPGGALISNADVLNGGGNNDGGTRLALPVATADYFTKGQSFTLAEPTDLTAITVRIDENFDILDGEGEITLSFYQLSGVPDDTEATGQIPVGAALASQIETLPAIVTGDYLTVSLDSPLSLTAGNYAFVFSTVDVDIRLDFNRPGATRATRNGTYPEGELVRANGEGTWEDRDFDLVFAIGGESVPNTISSPSIWPATFLENEPQPTAGSTRISPGTQVGQSFSVVGKAELDSVLIQLDEAIASTDLDGSLELEISAADGSGLPTGPALATFAGELAGGLGPGSFLEFDFPGTVTLPLGDYVIVFTSADADLQLNSSAGDLIGSGTLLGNSGAGWAAAVPAGQDLVFGLVGSLTPPVVRPPASDGPNILVILADDFSWTDLSSHKPNLGNGSDFHQTPHLDRLADEGLSFTYTFVHQNCAPTRAALFSGQYPARSGNGVYNVTSLSRGSGETSLTPPGQNEDVPADHYNLAEMLFDAGYATCHVGKFHVGGHEGGSATLPLNQGFDINYGGNDAGAPGSFFASAAGVFDQPSETIDEFGAQYTNTYINDVLIPVANSNAPVTLVGTNKHLTDAEGDAVIKFLDDHRSGELSDYPFYIQYHPYAVHTPIQSRSDLTAKYNGLPSGTRHDSSGYAGFVEGLDMSVGRILNYLDDPNGDGDNSDSIAEETLVIFLSDNGGEGGTTENAPLRSNKGSLYNGGIRVPMIVRQPGTVPADTVSASLVHAVDLFPTLMQAAGGSTTEILDGFSFYDHALDPAVSPRDREPIFYHFPGYLDNRARPCSVVIKDFGGIRYKLIYNYDFAYDPSPGDDAIMVLSQPWELYNITDDISESNNLIADNYWEWLLYGTIADEMAADLHGWLTQSDPTWNARQPSSGGLPLSFAPAAVPDVTVPKEQIFLLTDLATDRDALQARVEFTSALGYLYEIQASADLEVWTPLATGVVGQAGSTSVDVSDSGLAEGSKRYYRVVLTGSP